MLPITLLVITRNEAKNIARCLDSVPFAAEKIIIDSGSTDDTCDIASAHGARAVHQDWLGFGPQRNFASTQASNDWIIFLDADEELSPALIQECEQRLPELINSSIAGIILKRSVDYMGAAMRWYRPMVGEKIARIYNRQHARWTDTAVHESLICDSDTVTFSHVFIHYHSPTLVHKHTKVLTYSEIWARTRYEKKRNACLWILPFLFSWVFIKNYIFRCAIFDGQRGLSIAFVAAYYSCYKRLRLFEITRDPSTLQSAEELLPPSIIAHNASDRSS